MTPCSQPTETDPATGQTAFAQDFGHNRSLYILLEPVNIPKGVSGIIAFIGRNTLGLYFIHWIVIAAMHALGFSISPQFGYTIVPYLIAGLLIMLIGMCICWLIRRIPFANRLITP